MFSSPNVTLNAPCDILHGMPSAVSTCDGSGSFELHAEPLDAHIPF